MGLLDKLWDDVIAGPLPESGLKKLRVNPLTVAIPAEGEDKYQRSMSMVSSGSNPGTPTSPGTPSSARKENVWRSVFNPGSNLKTRSVGAQYYDKPQPSSPTVYDWLYSGETKSMRR